MTTPPPKIDPRTYAELVAQTEQLAQRFSPWKPAADGSVDAGRALIRIFGRMATIVTDRLNRVPEKHFLSFLNLIGVEQQPPRPAKVPLTAYLVDNSPVDAMIPAHTQIAAVPQAGETEEVLFETVQDLVVMRSQLQAAIVRETQKYCNHIVSVTTAASDFPVFVIEEPNTVYIAVDQLTTAVDSKEIKLAIGANLPTTPANSQETELTLTRLGEWKWSYWNGKIWQSLNTRVDDNQLKLTISPPEDWQPPQSKSIEGVEAQWLRGIAPGVLPAFNDDQIKLVRSAIPEIAPEQAFFNTEAIDLNKDFLPLGETPRLGDTFYIASQSIFSCAGVDITVNFAKSQTQITAQNVQIQWQVWTGKAWEPVLRLASNPNASRVETDANKTATVEDFIPSSGAITFQLPSKVAPVEVNGVKNYWIRARLIAGTYGSEPRFTTSTTTNDTTKATTTTTTQVPNTGYFPPSLQSVTLSRGTLTNIAPEKLLRTLPSGAFVHPHLPEALPSEQGFYLCFDRPFPQQAIALYLQVSPLSPGALQKPQPVVLPAKLQWEYFSAQGWRSLVVQDGTQNLSQRGMVEFIGPSDLAPQRLFSQSGYWLRLRLVAGAFQIPPRLQRVLTNTVWATQAVTYQDEVLGSGTGNPDLVLRTLHTPVLPGQQLMVRESELPPVEEQDALRSLVGEDAIAITLNDAGQPQEIWVHWQDVSDFYGSGSRDRHYTLDRMTGEIRFGGAGQGMAPPLGRNNIRMVRYQSGGGRRGNRPAATLTELRTTVPYVDRVTNLEPAAGGADLESIASVQESGPKRLRHGDRAVAWQDIEDLTYAASSEVARVRVIPPKFDPVELPWLAAADLKKPLPTDLQQVLQQAGRVKVLVVPHSNHPQPTPSLALIEQIGTYLQQRIDPGLQLTITDPDWVKVTVEATVVPSSLAAANGLETLVQATISHFLHPLTGGQKGKGWIFGRQPHESDLYACIERIAGVSYVKALNINIQTHSFDNFLIYSGVHRITIDSG